LLILSILTTKATTTNEKSFIITIIIITDTHFHIVISVSDWFKMPQG